MRLLALDTSSDVAAVAVTQDDRVLGEYILNHGKKHSVKLMPVTAMLLKDLSLKPVDIDVFAASSGPGSFTGLRIGITTIKSMAYAAGRPAVSVPSLDVLAFNASLHKGIVCPMMDARNNQVYTAVYAMKNEGIPERDSEYMGVHIEEIAGILIDRGEDVVFTGDAASIHRTYLEEQLGVRAKFPPHNLLLNRASSVAHLAWLKAESGDLKSCFNMVPFYLRKSQAEREYDKRNKQKA